MIWLLDIAKFILRPLYWLAGKVFGIWARPLVRPDDPLELIENTEAEVCYVLETGGLADLLALERACAKKRHAVSYRIIQLLWQAHVPAIRRVASADGFFLPEARTGRIETAT